MAKVPLPPVRPKDKIPMPPVRPDDMTPVMSPAPAKAVKPEDQEISPRQAAYLKSISDAGTEKNRYEDETEAMRENPINKAKGGSVKARASSKMRGGGCATKGHGKGKMY